MQGGLCCVFNIPLSTGTIKNIVSRCAEKIKPALAAIRKKPSESPLVHCDETGTNIDGKMHWVHNVSNENYKYMTARKKRGNVKRSKNSCAYRQASKK